MDRIKIFIHEIFKKCCDLGISDMNNEVEEKTAKWFNGMPEEVLNSMEIDQISGMVLSMIVPITDKLYSFDMEVIELGNMYTSFLHGISSIIKNEMKIEDIVEDTSQVDYESGSGKQLVYFKCNGQQYKFEASVHYDWFDATIIPFVNQILENLGYKKRLLVTGDGMQECILFYNTEEWADKFHQIMGYPLEQPK